jgi:UDP-glucuronate 4-epimerase
VNGVALGSRPLRVCVTGGLGFIGGHLCRRLAERGHGVLCIDRSRGARQQRVAGQLNRMPEVDVVRADVARDSLEPLLEGMTAVVHLAALPGARARHGPDALWRENVLATARLLRALPPGGRLVLASTSSVYGNAARLPTPERCVPAPLNPYAASKRDAEHVVLAAARAGAEALICRLFTVFGPGQRSDMAFARWIRGIVAGAPVPWCAHPGARREFTYVDDAVSGLIAALANGSPGEAYNLPGAGSVPVRAALGEIEELLGRRARLAVGSAEPEAVATAACGEKARRELGYVPRVGLRDGLERQVEATAGTVASRSLHSWFNPPSAASAAPRRRAWCRQPVRA